MSDHLDNDEPGFPWGLAVFIVALMAVGALVPWVVG